ncbi:hypothetical protein TNCV_1323151 [Trichonephila clavipes]|nr:hypothetical protein TNCV_1323151 [Trichonephila clavipes]
MFNAIDDYIGRLVGYATAKRLPTPDAIAQPNGNGQGFVKRMCKTKQHQNCHCVKIVMTCNSNCHSSLPRCMWHSKFVTSYSLGFPLKANLELTLEASIVSATI